ncbi:39S ribosomal protein L52, mitochondrial [Condylostylus longicornis]|uniref:39S ribosomal protein L52, mitochondrial n=1 Tax=Condylostylus longicornis TaxID=2530218 RepID=UPI00244DCE61|nr:39S ribosomal protein L52, mitochondrial [Condylostylus longicornis]
MFLKPNNIRIISKWTSREISSCTIFYNKNSNHWRELGHNPNSFGPLTNLPDYTYMDGRPTPLGCNMKKRLDKQKEIAKKIVDLNKELAFAKDRHIRLQKEKSELIEKQVAAQLKPKGHLLK